MKLSLFPPYAITKKKLENWTLQRHLAVNEWQFNWFPNWKIVFYIALKHNYFFTLALDTFVLLKFIGIKLGEWFFPVLWIMFRLRFCFYLCFKFLSCRTIQFDCSLLLRVVILKYLKYPQLSRWRTEKRLLVWTLVLYRGSNKVLDDGHVFNKSFNRSHHNASSFSQQFNPLNQTLRSWE